MTEIPAPIYHISLLIILIIICSSAWTGTMWLFHLSYPVTTEYIDENITERFVSSGMFIQEGVIVSDSGNMYPLPIKEFLKIRINHRYRIEFSYNLTPFVANPVSKGTPYITNITEI